MATTKRMNQIASTIQREISIVLRQEGTYIYGNALVTVTQVKMTPDLGLARIYLSVYNVQDKSMVVELVSQNLQRIRQSLAYRVKKHMRRVPNLEFFEDDTLDEMYRLRELFDKIETKDPSNENTDDTKNE